MSDLSAIITAIAALLAAAGGILAAVLAHRARRKIEDAAVDILLVKGDVHEVGRRIDGRLSELLASSSKLARAEGHAEGEQAQRDRAADSQP